MIDRMKTLLLAAGLFLLLTVAVVYVVYERGLCR
jgi:hypothetical protein